MLPSRSALPKGFGPFYKTHEFVGRHAYKFAFALAAFYVAASHNPYMTDRDAATDAVETAGFQPVTVGGYRWRACGLGEPIHTEFTAVNEYGRRVTGVVCSGVTKAARLEFD